MKIKEQEWRSERAAAASSIVEVGTSCESLFIGCYKPPTSVTNSKSLGDGSSKWEPAENQDFFTGSGSVNPKLPEIRDSLDLDLESTNSVLSFCDKPATSGDNLESW
ncbi:unnamed protein product [Camellia sinensis]